MNKLATLILLILSSTSARTQSSTPRLVEALDSLIPKRLPTIAPGCAILIAQKNQILYKMAFGSANLELNVPMTPDMVFRIGSITKQYTAIAILQLAEQGKLSLKDQLQKYLPNIPLSVPPVTLEHLLTHTSGIPDYEVLNFPVPTAIRVDFPARQIIDSLMKLPLEFTPGSRFHYSNSNYFLLAYILEQVTGLSYPDYLQQHLFTPAGLTHTTYDSPEKLIPGRVSGYAGHDHRWTNAGYISMTQVFGAGALVANVEDMYKWHQALYAGRLVKRETLEKALTPFVFSKGQASEYGYGWFLRRRNNQVSIEHSGGIDGFQADEIYLPEQDLFIATLYNALNEGGEDAGFMALDNDIATLAAGGQLVKEATVDPAILKRYVGVYRLDPKHEAIITLENGQLHIEAKAGGLPKSPLTPKDEKSFLLKILDAEVVFVTENNVVTQLVVHFKGQEQIAKKVR